MKLRISMAAGLVALAGTAAPALAQDSISLNQGLPGDALDAYAAENQVQRYVVDLTPFMASMGTEFGIAPIVKASLGDPAFFNHLMSAQAISRTMLQNQPFSGAAYAVWNTPGAGVNASENSAPNSITPNGVGNQFAVAFNEFGGEAQNLVGALVNVDPVNTSRLFVSRIMAAVNGTSFGEEASSMGGVAVDSNGNTYFRSDGFGISVGNLPAGSSAIGASGPGDDNVFRVKMQNRAAMMLNLIDDAGGSDIAATDRLIANSADTISVASGIAEQIAGRPILVGTNFNDQVLAETMPNVVTASAGHLSGLGNGAQRGSIAVSESVLFPNSSGTLALLTKPNGSETNAMSVWGVDNNANIVGSPLHLIYPGAGAMDNIDPFSYIMPVGGDTGFDHYHSQVAFRGGVSQIALGSDAQGRGLAGAVAYIVGGNNDPSNVIPVARFDANTGAIEWALAAWADATQLGEWPEGKPIRDASGAAIGELTTLFQVTGGSPFGPSMSSPGIDAAGNLWFLSAVQLYNGDDDDLMPFNGLEPTPPNGDDIYTSGLIRAVYDEANFGWNLELVFRLGDTFRGQNSDTDWTVAFLGIADADSISSGSFFSHNVMETAWNGMDTSSLSTNDPRHSGGVIVNASIAYTPDVEGAMEERYNAALFVGAMNAENACPQDLTGDQVVNGADLANLLANWGMNPGAAADFNGDGLVNGADLAALLANWGDCI